ncbi:MAG: hypothetical protein Q9228_001830 [Teloschistes exilis]
MAGVLPASASRYSVHNCTAWPEAQGDPDIAGIGVIVGFMLSAVLTLAVVIFHYIFDIQRMHENPVDCRFLNAIRSKKQKSKIGSAPEDAWSAAMEASVLMFSDIQATTGQAVMLGAYSQLHRGLNAYHWQVAISLAWFSSLTHLATLSSLRACFLERPKIAIYRATYMGIPLVLLIVAYCTTGYVQQSGADQSPSWPAECLFSGKNVAEVEKNDSNAKVGKRAPFDAPLILFSIAFLLINYVTRVVRIFAPLARSARKLLKEVPRRRLRRWYSEAARRGESDGHLTDKKAEQHKNSAGTTGINPAEDDAERQTHDSPSRQDEMIRDLDVSDRVWFPKLLGLIFGLALFLIGTCLFNFPAAPINKGGYWNTDKLADGYAMGTLVVQYIVLVGICGFEVVVFIARCLARSSSQRRPFMERKIMSWGCITVILFFENEKGPA